MELLKIQMQDAGRVAAQLKVLNKKFTIENLRVLNWNLKIILGYGTIGEIDFNK